MRIAACLILIGALNANAAGAAETWRCVAADGHKYTSTQDVPSDRCQQDAPELWIPDDFVSKTESATDKTAKLFCKMQKGATCLDTEGGEEKGEFMGAKYRLYSESAAVAASPGGALSYTSQAPMWDIGCSRDKMTSKRTCHVKRGDLYLFYSQPGAEWASIGNEHFPGSSSAIKIGTRRYDTTHRDGDFPSSLKIGAQLKDGTPVVTRYMKWPYRTWVDDEYTVHGAQTAIHLAKWLLKNGKF